MICPKCGNPIDDENTKFCNECGARLSTSDLPSYEYDERELTSQAYPRNSNYVDKSKPEDYLIWAILSTVLCCLPFGIYAIVCSTRVGKNYNWGDYEEARKQSEKAKKWSIIAFCSGLAVIIIYAIIALFSYFAADSKNEQDIQNYLEAVDTVYADTSSDDEYDADALSEKTENFLAETIESEKESLPEDMGGGMTLTNIELEDDYVVYTITCDEDLLDVSLLGGSDSKMEMLNSFAEDTDEDIQYFLKLCRQANKGVMYKYIGDTSGESSTIRIYASELRRIAESD